MNIPTFCKLGFAFFLPMGLLASPIPVYQVASFDDVTIHLTDDSVFALNADSWENFHEWSNGDLIEFYHNEQHFPRPIVNVGGLLVLEPVFLISNTTQGISAFGYLSAAPQLNLLTIASFDNLAGTITLDDASIWNIREADQRLFGVWNAGDLVLIGHNSSLDKSDFDAFILNASHIQVAHAVIAGP